MSEAAPGPAAWYVYGVVPTGARHDAVGVASSPVELLADGAVAALTSPVPADEFSEAALRMKLDDPAWLEQTARTHERVLAHALEETPVVPLRMCTIFASREHVRAFLAERGSALGELLARLDGRVELGVKAYFDRARFGNEPAGEPMTGRDYLLRRQRERELDAEAGRFKADCAADSHQRLAAAAEDARLNPPQPPELTGRSEEMLLNGAYLVRREATRLAETVGELQARYGPEGVTFETTGPWPPYHFVPRDVIDS